MRKKAGSLTRYEELEALTKEILTGGVRR